MSNLTNHLNKLGLFKEEMKEVHGKFSDASQQLYDLYTKVDKSIKESKAATDDDIDLRWETFVTLQNAEANLLGIAKRIRRHYEGNTEGKYVILSDMMDSLLDIVGEDEEHELVPIIESIAEVLYQYDKELGYDEYEYGI